ncbi:MAG: UDP-N-acetylmuramoyl-L-alanyl-D-glutamate--2,6-diaminopimelate ligase [Chloroflexi bacterium]|nr:UDP-N-acetylmuramoyl-L-alanyl-D-glutamate--2,6-diaminopimelate ligase [Chloroflexota bacterium]MCC6896728.1 UDP-N-acetylmuramoyl-L-alanyl-D-glutamate--2,6-diaminopimelate ligase [Anaerolineae bacterium]
MKRLADLIAALPDVTATFGDLDTLITAPVEEDNRLIQQGGVFVARRGLTVDGHNFIPDAIKRGAAAIIGERELTDLPVPYIQVPDAQEATGWLAAAYHDYPSRKLVLIGVTGTDGKTTTSTLIHSILKVATEGKAGLISTVSADLGGTTVDTGLHVTTPSAPQIQALLAQMVSNGLTHCVLEMTSHGLAQGRLNGVDIDVAVLTNLTHEHLDYHGTFEAYRAAKGRMFEMLGKSYHKPNQPKISVINADDPNADFFAAFPADRAIRYGIHKVSEVFAKSNSIEYKPDGIHLVAFDAMELFKTVRDGDLYDPRFRSYSLNLVGEFNVYNALAAIAATNTFHWTKFEDIEKGLQQVKSIPGRMERIDEGQPYTAIVDFAHTPNALQNALNAARGMLSEGKRLIAVFGSAGLRDREKRRLMAEVSARIADFTILTAEDPRTESLDDILETMAQGCISQGGVEGQTFIRIPDRSTALYHACQMAQPGDIVIACGKGHEQSMCFGTVEYLWDDRVGLRAAINGSPLKTLPTAQ